MARVRLSEAEAQAEATRRAAAFIAGRDDRHNWRHVSTTPDVARRAGKVPVGWVAMYARIAPDGTVIDGGELLVIVDLASGSVGLRQ